MEKTLLNDLRMSLEDFADKKVSEILKLMHDAANALEQLTAIANREWVEYKEPYNVNCPPLGLPVFVEYRTVNGLKYCTGKRIQEGDKIYWSLDSQYAHNSIVKRWRGM